MEEGVTEPEPQAVELTGMPPGTPSEVNGDLPGNPYLRDGAGVMESPVREPAVLQYPAEYSQQYGGMSSEVSQVEVRSCPGVA
ncbi:Mating-type-like protein ALPHA2 silenced copy at MTL3, partial [Dissostichus eleginoides]